VGKHKHCLTKENCVIITKFLQKYASLTLSLDVTRDIIYTTLPSKANLRLVNLNNEAVCKLCFPSTYQDKKFVKDVFLRSF